MARPNKNLDGRQVILACAEKLLIKQGLSEMTARNVATASGYGLGSIYFYFDNINDLLLQINGETISKLDRRLSELEQSLPAKNKLVLICQAYFDFAFDNKELWAAVMNYRRDGKEKSAKAYQAKIEKVTMLVQQIITPHLKPGQEAAEMAHLLWAGMQGIWLVTMREGFKVTTREQAKKMVEILVKNLFK